MSAQLETNETLQDQMLALGRAARAAAAELATTPGPSKDLALRTAAATIRARKSDILAANQQDVETARARGTSEQMIERLVLNDARIEGMARGLEDIADFPDPIGGIMADWTRPNGLAIQRVRVPLGVIGIIYESRPNVTADAGGLCLKSGNAAILRGGSESKFSSRVIAECLATGLSAAGLPVGAIQLVQTTDRAAVGEMLRMPQYIDVIVPRGGKSLIQRISEESRVPVIKHLDGNNHVYVDATADLEIARNVLLNAKMRRTSVCGAAENLLVDRKAVESHLPTLVKALLDAGCAVRGDEVTQAIDPRVTPVDELDWGTEYLDAIIAVGLIDGVDAAIDHINQYGSHHTDCIITEDTVTADRFLQRVDSAIVLVNASTQFADGGEFGMGAEIGISTDKFHARGPVGAEQLTSYKYVVRGTGQTRP